MKPRLWLRILAWGKRATLALESIARSQAQIAEASSPKVRRSPKMAQVFTPTVESMNAEWQRQRDAEIYGEEPAEYDRN